MPRAFQLGTLHQWHWISSGLSLAGRLPFAISGQRSGRWPASACCCRC